MNTFYLKSTILILIIIISSYSTSLADTRQYSFKGGSQDTDMRYSKVYIDCYINLCEKKCEGYGGALCDWETALQAPCLHCSEDFIKCQGQDMFDYVYNQTAQGNMSGQYSNNIYDESTNTYYYRTIEWDSTIATLYVTELVSP